MDEPTVIGVILARGGSERVPRKNMLPIAGVPLIAHSIRHAQRSRFVAEIYLSTDDDEIAEFALRSGARVVRRPPELAASGAASEPALLHVLDERRRTSDSDPDLVVFLQPTSPARREHDVDQAVARLLESGADSLFSATPSKRLLWRGPAEAPSPWNYDPAKRPREQEMDEQWYENGSIYVFRPEVLRRYGHRVAGRVVAYEMDAWSSFQLDEPEDVDLLEWIMGRPEFAGPVPWPDRVDLVVFDFDGVLTDNTVVVGEGGAESVRCSRADGLGIAALREAGVEMLVISTEEHPVVASRCAKLRLPCRQAIADKRAELERVLSDREIDPAHVVYVGNDVNDLGCFGAVGLSVAVADAERAVRERASLVLSRPGGRGAVRELAELVLARLGQPLP